MTCQSAQAQITALKARVEELEGERAAERLHADEASRMHVEYLNLTTQLQEQLGRVREVLEQEATTFFRCYACGHQHDNFLPDIDVYSMLTDILDASHTSPAATVCPGRPATQHSDGEG